MRARYCRKCGAPVLPVELDRPGRPVVVVCAECGTREGQRPVVGVAGLLLRSRPEGREVLLARFRPETGAGAGGYALPYREVGWGEDVRDTITRAFWELAGLRVRVDEAVDVASARIGDENHVRTWFRVVTTASQEPVAGTDADAVAFFPLDQLPDLSFEVDRLVLARVVGDDTDDPARRNADLATHLHRQTRRYRELFEAYGNELLRGAWVNDLHQTLGRLQTVAELADETAQQVALRPEVDVIRFWAPGTPDRCSVCVWADRCDKEACLHLLAAAASPTPDAPDVPTTPKPEADLERVPLIAGIPAADVALQGKLVQAELPGAGARPFRFEGFPLEVGGEHRGVLGLVSEVPMEANARRLFGVVAHYIGPLMRNARLLDDLRRANEIKLGFIARMSHELKTPLTAILGYADLLKAELMAEGHELGVDGAATIEESGRKLLDIVETILELAKLESGAIRLRTEPLSLSEEAGKVLARYSQRAREVEVALELFPSATPDRVKVDRRRLRQVLEQLLDNALKFTPAGGRVNVRIEGEERDVRCTVEDTGIGVARGHHKRIFDAFYQVSEKIHLDFGGLGIGLSVAKMVIELMGGTIGVESELDAGSKFTFTLPRLRDEPS